MKINKQIWVSLGTMLVVLFLLFYFLPAEIKSINDLLFTFGGFTTAFLVGCLVFYRQKKDAGSNEIVFMLPSIIGLPFNSVSAIILSGLFTVSIYSMLTIGTWILSFAMLLFIAAAFLLVPKKIVLDSKMIINDRFWKEKWENIEECIIYEDVVEIKTKNNKIRSIKKVDRASLVFIEYILKEYMKETNCCDLGSAE